jgi:hypothetical protein
LLGIGTSIIVRLDYILNLLNLKSLKTSSIGLALNTSETTNLNVNTSNVNVNVNVTNTFTEKYECKT